MRNSFARFVAGGGLTYAASVTLMALWVDLAGLGRLPAYALTHSTVLVLGFALNRHWVFRANASRVGAQGLRFALANAGFRVVDWCLYSMLELLLGPPVWTGVLAANLAVLPLKYLFYRRHVFAGPGPAAAERAT